ncbi:MAG: hypothetical protein HY059_10100 [Proteobacteria bacterium]|nr:hypothetical protein [Pseudomonadota bacterium]
MNWKQGLSAALSLVLAANAAAQAPLVAAREEQFLSRGAERIPPLGARLGELDAAVQSGDTRRVAGAFGRMADNSAERPPLADTSLVYVAGPAQEYRTIAYTRAVAIPQPNLVALPPQAAEKKADAPDCEAGFDFKRGLIDAMKTNFGGHIVDSETKMPHGKCTDYRRGRRYGHFASIVLSGVEVAGGATVVGAQILAAVACTFSPGVLLCWKALGVTLAASIVTLIHGVFQIHAAILNLDEDSRLEEGDIVRRLPGEIVENPPDKLQGKTVFKVRSEDRDVYIVVHEPTKETGRNGRRPDRLLVYDAQWKCLGMFAGDLKSRVDDCPKGY